MIRVLIVDDSPVAAEILTVILQADPDITVVGTAHNGLEAVEITPRLQPDLITMDVWMPQMDGFATVEQIMAYYPTPILVITTSLARKDIDISLTMLAAGALDVMEKPSRLDEAAWDKSSHDLIRKVKQLARVRVVTHLKGRRGGRLPGAAAPPAPPTVPVLPVVTPGARPPPAPPPAVRPLAPPPASSTLPGAAPRRRGTGGLGSGRRGGSGPLPNLPLHPRAQPGVNPYTILAIASSTGGPQALLALLRNLPPNFPLPILVVQHIAAGFTQGLADWLGRECLRPVRLATEGTRPPPGVVLLAPDSHHLMIGTDGRVHLDAGPPMVIRPAADMLLRSLAPTYGPRAIGVILTGMGRDGADGLKALRMAGGYTIAQDESTSLIFGMPRAAINLGVVDDILALPAIAPRLAALVTGHAP